MGITPRVDRRVTVALPPDLLLRLEERAGRERRSLSAMAALLIREGLVRKQQPRPFPGP